MKNFKKIESKKLFSLLMAVVMILQVLVITPTYAADDTRTIISKIVATSDINSIPKYGENLKKPTFTVTQGKPTYFDKSSGSWWKKDGTRWIKYTDTTFKEGTYRYKVQVRIDGEAAKTHAFNKNGITVIVDGTTWVDNGTPGVSDISFKFVFSKEYVIKAPVGKPLVFTKNNNWNIGLNYVGKAITSFSVATGATGGEKPYTFSKVSGPDWISVASDGTVSGTPKKIGTNDDLVIRVTDKNSATKEITLTVAKTAQDPSTRTKISNIEATSDIDSIPVYGGIVKKPTFNVTQGSPAHLEKSTGKWWKKEGTELVRYTEATFVEGTYEYQIQVRVDGDAGKTHVLDSKGVTVTVDGYKWADMVKPSIGDTFSYSYASSKEYIVSKPAQEIVIEIPKANTNLVYTGNPQTGVNEGTGYTLTDNTATNAGTYTAKATLEPGYKWSDGSTGVKEITWTIAKAKPTYTEPTNLTGKKGAKLSTVTLPSGFTWVDGETILNTVGEKTFKAKFTPADTDNYKEVEVDIKVLVEDNIIPPPVPTNPVKPTVKTPKNFTYDGTEKQVTLINFDESTMTLSGDIKKIDAGAYTLTITSKTGMWSDGSTDAKEVEWEIFKAKLDGNINLTPIEEDGKTLADVVVNGNFTFNGKEVVGQIVWTDDTFNVLPGTTPVEYQKSYNWLFKPASGNFNQVSGTAVIYPTKAAQETVIDIPVANPNLTYNAKEQIGVNEGIGYTLTGDTATNAGNYTATATLDAGYKWNDGTKEVKNIPFEIRKAVPSFTAPINLTGKKGSTLSTVTLPSEFAWVDGTKILDKVGDIEFVAVYTPQDTENYESVNVVLTVKVEENITPPTPMTYTVSFDGNDGGGTMPSKTVNAGDIYKLPVSTFTPPVGKEFKAWEVNGVEKTVGTDITINSNTVLKAIWKDKSVTPPTPPTPGITPNPWGPRYEYNPFWQIYFGSTEQIAPKQTTKEKTEVVITIGSKIMERTINGVYDKIMMDIAPFIEENRTMLPIRFVAEALGFKVEWISESRTVVLTNRDNVVKIPVDTNQIIVNGKVYESDVKPVLRNNRTMLPIANIARALGLKDGTDILWDKTTKKVTIIREQIID